MLPVFYNGNVIHACLHARASWLHEASAVSLYNYTVYHWSIVNKKKKIYV